MHLGGYLNVLAAALPHHGGGRPRSDPRRHVGLGLAAGRHRRLRLRQARRRRAHLGARPVRPGGRGRQRHVADRRHPHGHRRARSRARRAVATGGSSATGGLSLGSMPQPEELGPLGAHLVGDGPVVVLGPGDLRRRVRGRGDRAASPAGGGADRRRRLAGRRARRRRPRCARARRGRAAHRRSEQPEVRRDLRRGPGGASAAPAVRSCAVVTDRPELGAAVSAALSARSIACHTATVATDFAGASASLEAAGAVDAVVVALAGATAAGGAPWERILAEHAGITDGIHADAAWARAVADRSAATERPIRLVTLTDATHRGRPQPGAGGGPARPLGPSGDGRPRGGVRGERRERGRPRSRQRRASSPVTCSEAPMPRSSRAPSWWSAPAGSACAATPIPRRASRSADRRSPAGSMACCAR